VSGEGQVGLREKFCTRKQWAWNGLLRAVGQWALLEEFKSLSGIGFEF